jgi:hypothetical protein
MKASEDLDEDEDEEAAYWGQRRLTKRQLGVDSSELIELPDKKSRKKRHFITEKDLQLKEQKEERRR